MLNAILRFASRLRFPTLFLLTGALFVADLVIPDVIPLADEMLLGLLTLVFGAMRKRRSERPDVVDLDDDDVIDLPPDEKK